MHQQYKDEFLILKDRYLKKQIIDDGDMDIE